MHNEKFIITSDANTKTQLQNIGLTKIMESNDMCVFLNTPHVAFDNKNLKIAYSNILTF